MSILQEFSTLLTLLADGSGNDAACRALASRVQDGVLNSPDRVQLEKTLRQMADGAPAGVGFVGLEMVGVSR